MNLVSSSQQGAASEEGRKKEGGGKDSGNAKDNTNSTSGTKTKDSDARLSTSERKFKSRALKELAAEHLGLEIQHGEHSPVEDARAALYLYHKHRIVWERSLNGQKNSKKTFVKSVVSNKTGTSSDLKKSGGDERRSGVKKRERERGGY